MIRSWGYLKPFQRVVKSRITTWASLTDRRRGSNSITETASSFAGVQIPRYLGFPGGFLSHPCDNVKNMRKSNWIISPQMIEKGWKNQNFENLVSDAILDQFWLNFALMMVSRHILATKKLEFWQQEFLAADFFQSVLIKITQH